VSMEQSNYNVVQRGSCRPLGIYIQATITASLVKGIEKRLLRLIGLTSSPTIGKKEQRAGMGFEKRGFKKYDH